MDADELERIQARVRRYDFEDGLADLTVGAFASTVGALNLVLPRSLVDSTWAILVPLGAALLSGAGLKWTRERLTYRRTGRAVLPPRRRVVAFVAAFVLTALVLTAASALQGTRSPWRAPYFLEGMAIVVGVLGIALWRGLPRFAVVGGVQFGFAVALALAHVPTDTGMPLLLLGFGLALLGSGGFALARYLKRTRPLASFEEETDGER